MAAVGLAVVVTTVAVTALVVGNWTSKATTADKTKDVLTKAVIGGIVGATAGTLYGLNESSQNDERARDAYRTCMRERGYAG